MYTGELISLGVAFSWTATALFAEVASKRIGSLPFNVIRMALSLALLAITLWLLFGVPYPLMADSHTWFWLSLSGFVGYVLGDFCLFKSYILMNSRFGQLFMTLASPSAAITAWLLLGEKMSTLAILGMIVTMTGIGMSVLYKGANESSLHFKMPVNGILYGIGAAMGQGVGLVLSKVGMDCYMNSIAQYGIEDIGSFIPPNALFSVPMEFSIPFASTMIRAVTGIIGFSTALILFSKNGRRLFRQGITDKRTMSFAIGAAIFGPFVGVSLSLMATLYTNTGIAQTIMAITPVIIILPSWLFFHQKVTLLEVIGAIISVAGVTLFFI